MNVCVSRVAEGMGFIKVPESAIKVRRKKEREREMKKRKADWLVAERQLASDY